MRKREPFCHGPGTEGLFLLAAWGAHLLVLSTTWTTSARDTPDLTDWVRPLRLTFSPSLRVTDRLRRNRERDEQQQQSRLATTADIRTSLSTSQRMGAWPQSRSLHFSTPPCLTSVCWWRTAALREYSGLWSLRSTGKLPSSHFAACHMSEPLARAGGTWITQRLCSAAVRLAAALMLSVSVSWTATTHRGHGFRTGERHAGLQTPHCAACVWVRSGRGRRWRRAEDDGLKRWHEANKMCEVHSWSCLCI